MLVSNTETRPFFVQQSKSGRWNVWVFQRETDDGYKYTVKQTLKNPDDAYSWGLNYINHVVRYWHKWEWDAPYKDTQSTHSY